MSGLPGPRPSLTATESTQGLPWALDRSRVDEPTLRPIVVDDPDAWDEITFSAPGLQYFGVKRAAEGTAKAASPSKSNHAAAATAAAPAAAAAQPRAEALAHVPAATAPRPTSGSDATGSGDELLDDVDLEVHVNAEAQASEPFLASKGGRPFTVPPSTAILAASKEAATTVAAAQPTTVHEAQRPLKVGRDGSGGGSAWEVVDMNEASDEAMLQDATTMVAAQSAAPGSVVALPTALASAALALPGAGFLSRLAQYYQQTVAPTPNAAPLAATGVAGGPSAGGAHMATSVRVQPLGTTVWIILGSRVSILKAWVLPLQAVHGDARSFYDFIVERVKLKDPQSDARLRERADRLTPDEAERTIQVGYLTARMILRRLACSKWKSERIYGAAVAAVPPVAHERRKCVGAERRFG